MKSSVAVVLGGANFAVALGFGAILPLLPVLLERVASVGAQATDGLHTGGLTSVYMFALFLSAPFWGRLVDRIGARALLVSGLLGYAVALVALAMARDLWTAYALRAVAGMFAGVVIPIVSVQVAAVPDLERRGKLFAATGAAALLGMLLGPSLSGAVAYLMRGMAGEMSAQILAWSFGATAMTAVLVAGAVLLIRDFGPPRQAGARIPLHALPRALLAVNFLVLFGLGAFEVLMPLASETRLRLDAGGLALMFAECSLVMIAVQATLFFTPVLTRVPGWAIVASGFAAMAAGTAWFALGDTQAAAYAGVGLVAAGSGWLLPAIGYIATVKEARPAGALFGALTAAASLGQATGSALGGWLFERIPEGAFWVIAGVLAVGIALARAPALQASRTRGKAPQPHPQVVGHGS